MAAQSHRRTCGNSYDFSLKDLPIDDKDWLKNHFFSFLPDFMVKKEVLELIAGHSKLYRESIKVSNAQEERVNGIYHKVDGEQKWKQYKGKHFICGMAVKPEDQKKYRWYITATTEEGCQTATANLESLYTADGAAITEEYYKEILPQDYTKILVHKDVLYIARDESAEVPGPLRKWRRFDSLKKALAQGDLSTSQGGHEHPLPLECVAGPAIGWAFGGFCVLWVLGFFATPLIMRFWFAPCGYQNHDNLTWTWIVILAAWFFEWKCMSYTLLPQLMVQPTKNMLMLFGLSWLRVPNSKALSIIWLLAGFAYSALSKLDVINNAMFYGMTMSTFANADCMVGQEYTRIREKDGHWGLPLSFEVQVRMSWYAMMFQGVVALIAALPAPWAKSKAYKVQQGFWLLPDYKLSTAEYGNALRGKLPAQQLETVYTTLLEWLHHEMYEYAIRWRNCFERICFPPSCLLYFSWLGVLILMTWHFANVCWFPGVWQHTCSDLTVWVMVWFFAGGTLMITGLCGFFHLDGERPMPTSGHTGAFNALSQMARMNMATCHLSAAVKIQVRAKLQQANGMEANHAFLMEQASNMMVTGARKIGLMDTIGHALFLSWKIEVARLHAISVNETPSLLHGTILVSCAIALKNFSQALVNIKWGIELKKDFERILQPGPDVKGTIENIKSSTTWMVVNLIMYTLVILSGFLRIIYPALMRTTTTTGLPSTSAIITSTVELLAV